MGVVTNYVKGGGGGAQNGREGASKVLTLQKGGSEKVLAMLKGGGGEGHTQVLKSY